MYRVKIIHIFLHNLLSYIYIKSFCLTNKCFFDLEIWCYIILFHYHSFSVVLYSKWVLIQENIINSVFNLLLLFFSQMSIPMHHFSNFLWLLHKTPLTVYLSLSESLVQCMRSLWPFKCHCTILRSSTMRFKLTCAIDEWLQWLPSILNNHS